ncbi:anti-anti-sigma factor [Bacillus sp. M6-12]|nr:anti-anti-sigma factor [Bacillus sp. M6-12]
MNANETNTIEVGGALFRWNREEGTFLFEEQDAILFWINSAFKTFLDTIEEVSGDENASIVLEITGFRQGLIVGEFFQKEGLVPEQVLQMLPGIYASAGWGQLEIVDYDNDKKTAVMRMTNSWEYRINKLQAKTGHGTFVPGHWAGVLSGLWKDHAGYRVTKSQLAGDEYCEFEYFLSDKEVTQNIHDLARKREQEEITKLEKLVEKRTEELSQLIREISSPIIPVLENIVVVPLLGTFHEKRSKELLEKIISRLPEYQSEYVLLDVTGLNENISEYTLFLFQQLISATSLLGMNTIIVGLSPAISVAITTSKHHNLSGAKCFANLKHGIHYALQQEGKRIV